MRFRILVFEFVALSVLAWGLLCPMAARAQDDGPSLGDVARNIRKDKAQQQAQPASGPNRAVIDNDNLPQAMDEAKLARPIIQNKTVLSLDPSGNTLKVSSPDVTCSMSFNARASSLLIKPVLIEDLPPSELLKLDGPGSIQDDNLQLEVFNGTDWVLREVTVGLTLERKPGENAELAARARVIPASENTVAVTVERRSDVTLLYHLKTEAKPFSKTALRENIGITPGPDEDWRWSIVEAKGIRPASSFAPQSLSEPLFGSPLPFVPSTNEPAVIPGPAGNPAQTGVPLQIAPPADTPDKGGQTKPPSGAPPDHAGARR